MSSNKKINSRKKISNSKKSSRSYSKRQGSQIDIFTLKAYVVVCTGIFLLYVIAEWFHLAKQPFVISIMMLLCLLGIAGYGLYQYRIHKTMNLMGMLLAVGCVMRVGYMLMTPVTVRNYDLYDVNIASHNHASYLLEILNGGLPSDNLGQYYNPPFYYILSSIVVRIVDVMTSMTSIEQAIAPAKIVSCIASCGVLWIAFHLLKELNVNLKAIPVVMAFLACSPQFYLLGGRVNGDSLVTLFMTIILLYTIRWYQDSSVHNTVILALAYGLGMMTKISVASLAIVTGTVMIAKYVSRLRRKEWRDTLKNAALFSGIAFPLGMWYLIRNNIRFSQPLYYVLEPEKYGEIYVGNYSIVKRFLSIDFTNLRNSPYSNPWDDYNIPVYLLKGALFGEFTFDLPSVLAIIFLSVWIMLVFIIIVAFVAECVRISKDTQRRVPRSIVMATFVVGIISFVTFNIKYPYGCTMDFRYVAYLLVPVGVMLGDLYAITLENKKYAGIRYLITGILALFLICSISCYMFV